jgi:hypothetical protein
MPSGLGGDRAGRHACRLRGRRAGITDIHKKRLGEDLLEFVKA